MTEATKTSVVLYMPDFNSRHSCAGTATAGLSQGLTKLGIDHELRKTMQWTGAIFETCIVNGWLKAKIDECVRATRNDVIRAQAAAGYPAWCIERGFIGDREEWSSMSIGGFCATGGDFRCEDSPPDRWEALCKREGVSLKTWGARGDEILLCAQVPWDAQVQDGDHLQWLEDTIRILRNGTDRPIRFRPHPKAYRKSDPYARLSTEARAKLAPADLRRAPTTTFEEDLENAWAVVCFNSNTATLAILEGVPVFTGGQSNADPIACRELDLIEYPEQHDPGAGRDQWAFDMAYKQWNQQEFKEALPWLHLNR